jgi:glucose-6-phosphate isomerase
MRVQAEATRQALQESGRSTFVLKTQDLSPESLASLMGLWMLTVGALGELLDIDAFNQPGVESGKKITRRVLAESN